LNFKGKGPRDRRRARKGGETGKSILPNAKNLKKREGSWDSKGKREKGVDRKKRGGSARVKKKEVRIRTVGKKSTEGEEGKEADFRRKLNLHIRGEAPQSALGKKGSSGAPRGSGLKGCKKTKT